MKNWKQLTIYIGESDVLYHQPLYQVIMGMAHQHEITGVTVSQAIAGYGQHGIFRTFNQIDPISESSALPLMITIIDQEEKVANFFNLIQESIEGKFVTCQSIEIWSSNNK